MTARAASLEPPPWRPRCVRVGAWRVTALLDGTFALDGGSMWGVVPATIWRALTPPRPDNTIPLALRPFLAERDGLRVLVEVGIGDRWERKLVQRYGLDRRWSLARTLAAVGVAHEAITHVVATHCHWDHIGAQVIERDGRLEPAFPNARHFAPRVEIENARDPDHVRRASYRPDDVAPIEARGLLEPYEGEAELLPGLRAHVLGGHSDGVSVVTLEDGGETAVFWSDVVPTTHHVQPAYVMAYDIDVARSVAVRSEWIERAAEGGWTGLFYHDVDEPFGRIVRAGRRFACEPIAGEPVPLATA